MTYQPRVKIEVNITKNNNDADFELQLIRLQCFLNVYNCFFLPALSQNVNKNIAHLTRCLFTKSEAVFVKLFNAIR